MMDYRDEPEQEEGVGQDISNLPAIVAGGALEVAPGSPALGFITHLRDWWGLSKALAASGVVKHGHPQAVFAIVLQGYELGIPPMAALQNMFFADGKLGMSVDLMMGIAARRAGVRLKQVVRRDAEGCEIILSRPGWPDTTGRYTKEDAERAELLRKTNWKKYPERMYWHRARAFALRDIAPDVLSGIYSLEELDIDAENVPMQYAEVVTDDPFEDGAPGPGNGEQQPPPPSSSTATEPPRPAEAAFVDLIPGQPSSERAPTSAFDANTGEEVDLDACFDREMPVRFYPATQKVEPLCPEDHAPMYDNRGDKTNPKAPDFRCTNYKKPPHGTGCPGRLWHGQWPPHPMTAEEATTPEPAPASSGGERVVDRSKEMADQSVVKHLRELAADPLQTPETRGFLERKIARGLTRQDAAKLLLQTQQWLDNRRAEQAAQAQDEKALEDEENPFAS